MAYDRMKGFIMTPLLYALAGVSIVAVLSGGWAWVQGTRLSACKAEFAAFQVQVRALGEAAAKKAKDTEDKNRKAKEKADASYKNVSAANVSLARSLRDARSSRSYLPPAPAASVRPDRACFSRAELEREIQRLDDGIQELITEGDAARIGLDTARAWAKDIASP